MNKCECDFCKENIYKEHEIIECNSLKENIKNSIYEDKLLSYFEKKPLFSYFIGAFWLNDKDNKEDYYSKSVIIKPKIENIDFMKMFSKCFHGHFEHQKSRLFKRLFDILYTIRTRLFQEAY